MSIDRRPERRGRGPGRVPEHEEPLPFEGSAIKHQLIVWFFVFLFMAILLAERP
jgi:hypothetical protein